MANPAPQPTAESTPNKPKKKGVVREYVEAIGTALLIALVLRYFVIEAFKIPSASMVPTLLVGDHIFVNKFIYGVRIPFTNKKILQFRNPARGEIIVFIYPLDRSKDYIKRVVGVPGDKIEVKEGQLLINDKPIARTFQSNEEYTDVNQGCMPSQFERYDESLDGTHHHSILTDRSRLPSNYGPQWVEEGKLFVMGDNRDNSSDSRVWGFVPLENVKGKALFIWLSLDACGLHDDAVSGILGFRFVRFLRFFNGLH